MAFTVKVPDPIEVTTPSRGVVALRWASVRSLTTLDKLRKGHGATDEFVLRAMHDHLLSPTPSLDEFRAWPVADRTALVVAWAAHPLGLEQPIDPARLPAAFADAIDAHLTATGESMRKALGMGFDLIERQQQRILVGATAGISHALEGFRAREMEWRDSLLGSMESIQQAARFQESIQRHFALEAAAASQMHTRLLGDMASAVASNVRLLSVAPALAAMTDGLRASAQHDARLTAMASVQGSARVAAAVLSQGLESLVTSARAVWVDWERMAVPPAGAWLREAPGFEVFSASRAAAAAVGAPVEDEPSAAVERLDVAALRVEPLLARVNPELVRVYRGAAHAIQAKGPDSGRQLAISLRELLTHLLHHLAPDNALRVWDQARPEDPEDFANGRPTRRLRLRYIFRGLKGTAYEEFVSDDVGSAVELMQLLQGDTHRLERPLDPRSQRIVLRRVEGVLALLLEAAFGEA